MAAGATTHLKIAASPTVHITLDLPIPPSVNRTRRVDWAGDKKRRQFYLHVDLHLTAYGPRPPPVRLVTGPCILSFEIPLTSRVDLSNHCKILEDYLVSREFIGGDDKRHVREIHMKWWNGDACRVTITGIAA
jgi:hypothetical protein